MMNVIVAIAAGCAAGLMFTSIVSGALVSLVLVYLAPLPLMVAALGWGPATALLGGLGAGVGLGLVIHFFYGLGFVLMVALPAVWLGHLSLLARPGGDTSAPPALDWYPMGRVLLWTAAIAAAIMIFALLTMGSSEEEITNRIRERILPALNQINRELGAEDRDRLAHFIARALPLLGVGTTMLMYLANLWLAGRITQTSNRLRRPWPELNSIELPQGAIIALAALLLLSFVGGLPALIAQIACSVLLAAYTLVGFAVLHALTRPLSGRRWWLAAAYVSIPFLRWWPLLLVTMLGLLEGTIGLRRRFGNSVRPPSLPT